MVIHRTKQLLCVSDNGFGQVARVRVEDRRLPALSLHDTGMAVADYRHIVVGIKDPIPVRLEDLDPDGAYGGNRGLVEKSIRLTEDLLPPAQEVAGVASGSSFGQRCHRPLPVGSHDFKAASMSSASSASILRRARSACLRT